jgi:4'-phosphopantetheinyl transferase
MVIVHGTFNFLPDPNLTNDDVHIWHASIRQPEETVQWLADMLSADEKRRAERFHFERHRRSFIVARGVLRILLAHYSHCEAGQLRFEYTPTGKPFLASHSDGQGLCFNLSHSHELILYAISKNRRVGIDLEHIRPISEMEQIAASNFSDEENKQLNAMTQDRKLEAFFNCWTRKEAYIKAIGDGISFPLQQFDVSLKPGEPARLLRIFGSEQEATRWSMVELRPADGYTAALVIEGNGCSISSREWAHFEFHQST